MLNREAAQQGVASLLEEQGGKPLSRRRWPGPNFLTIFRISQPVAEILDEKEVAGGTSQAQVHHSVEHGLLNCSSPTRGLLPAVFPAQICMADTANESGQQLSREVSLPLETTEWAGPLHSGYPRAFFIATSRRKTARASGVP
jgi:hypothetical protein